MKAAPWAEVGDGAQLCHGQGLGWPPPAPIRMGLPQAWFCRRATGVPPHSLLLALSPGGRRMIEMPSMALSSPPSLPGRGQCAGAPAEKKSKQQTKTKNKHHHNNNKKQTKNPK